LRRAARAIRLSDREILVDFIVALVDNHYRYTA